ncbi:MAG: hypothetical protein CR982_04915 [Candidatus Cloacimonadota bacterium]|nr:MAG: hypothetical protein CR982_04915 [Candidatus Cloacimonadota bacterium]PIE77374.1 MAG: hypothetical protein CSA15_13310 [Candidatus Delongbacteria bacterium]
MNTLMLKWVKILIRERCKTMLKIFRKDYWESWELISIGIFAALVKILTFLISITGGGMNPISLMLKNGVGTTLLIILMLKVQKFGVFTIYVLINTVLAIIMSGGGAMMSPVGLIATGIITDYILGNREKTGRARAVLGILFFETFSRVVSLVIGYISIRETPQFFYMGVAVVSLGYLGCLGGVFAGFRFSKELKVAGIIKR